MKPEQKQKGLQGEGPPDDNLHKRDIVIYSILFWVLAIAVAYGLYRWLAP
jgi:hypothetical protein